jgi:hypothetical protein
MRRDSALSWARSNSVLSVRTDMTSLTAAANRRSGPGRGRAGGESELATDFSCVIGDLLVELE